MFVSKRKGDARISVALVVEVDWWVVMLVSRLRCRSLSFQVIVLSSRLGSVGFYDSSP